MKMPLPLPSDVACDWEGRSNLRLRLIQFFWPDAGTSETPFSLPSSRKRSRDEVPPWLRRACGPVARCCGCGAHVRPIRKERRAFAGTWDKSGFPIIQDMRPPAACESDLVSGCAALFERVRRMRAGPEDPSAFPFVGYARPKRWVPARHMPRLATGGRGYT